LSNQLSQEYVRLLDQYQADNPTHPAFFSSEQIDSVLSAPRVPTGDLLKLEHQLKKKLRLQARENLAIKQQEDAAKSATAKPLSGKRPRSAGPPAA
jgi:hypothetical protein